MNYIQKFKANPDTQKVNHHLKLTFNKKLVVALIITLAIPLTVTLSTQRQDIQKHASESESLPYKGYIVEFKDGPIAATRSISVSSARPIADRRIDISNQHTAAKNNILGILGKSSYESTSASINTTSSSKVEVLGEYEYGFNGVALNISDSQAQKLLSESSYVEAVYKNIEVNTLLNDVVPMVGVDRVWQVVRDSQGRVLDGRGVNVAVIDSGIDYKHADLGKSGSGQTFNSKVKGGYDLVNNDQDPIDDNGHGTHVAGIIASNGKIKGIAPGANIYAYKVVGSGGGGYVHDIQEAIESAIATHFDGDSSNDIHVINLSVGAYCRTGFNPDCSPDAPLSQMVDNATNEGIAVVVAAGNSGASENAINMPGNARSAITVGSINKYKEISSFSSRGPVKVWNENNELVEEFSKPDLVAPGEGFTPKVTSVPSPSPDPKAGICAAKFPGSAGSVNCIDSTHRSLKGTSMAAPVVAGLAALIKQKNPTFTGYDIKYILTQGASSLGQNENFQGRGMVDARNVFDFTPPPKKTVVITAYEDSYVDSDQKSKNFGNSSRMRVDGNPKKISYMKFDLGQLSGKRILSARLKLNIPTGEGSGSDNKFNLKKVGVTSWSENKINYNNKPGLSSIIASFNGRGAGSSLDIDVKSFVSSSLGKKVGIALTTEGSNDLILMTHEASSTRPRIVVEYQ